MWWKGEVFRMRSCDSDPEKEWDGKNASLFCSASTGDIPAAKSRATGVREGGGGGLYLCAIEGTHT